MFTVAIILMEMKRPRGQPRCVQGVRSQYYNALQAKRFSRTPSEFFCESLHTMHDNDHAGLVLVTETPPHMKSTTTSTTTAVINPVPVKAAKKVKYEDEDFVDGKGKEFDRGHAAILEGRRQPGFSGCIDDIHSKKVSDFTEIPKDQLALLGEDGDRLAALQDEITSKKDKRRNILEQIIKLEEMKRRFIRNTRLNHRKLRVSQRKRQELEHSAQTKVDHRYRQLVDAEKEKIGLQQKLERSEEIAITLAMQKEEKHRSLLQIIDDAPALYRKESEILEERHQREVVRYQFVMGLFLALLAVLLITYISRFGVKAKPATRAGLFY